jgi:hypothetical protein
VDAGIPIILQRGLPGEEPIFQVTSCSVESCLLLLLVPRKLSFELRQDGCLYVDTPDRLSKEPLDRRSLGVLQTLAELERMGERLQDGWNGLGDDRLEAAAAARAEFARNQLRNKTLTIQQGTSTLRDELRRLNEIGVDVDYNYEVLRDAFEKPVPNVVGQVTYEEHLERLAREFGLTTWAEGDRIALVTPDDRAWKEERLRQDRAWSEGLHRALSAPGPASIPISVREYAEQVARKLGTPVILSREAWESEETIEPPAGGTVRDALEHLHDYGFRWGVQFQRLYVLN